jgi:F-type H+-transporting ATPase subunit b
MANETAHTEVPAGGHTESFPPFDKQTFPSQLLWLTVSFVALYMLMARIALPRVESIFAERRQRVSGDVAEANRLKGESETAIALYESALADARGRAQALVSDSRERQNAEAEARRKDLDTGLNARIAEAENKIAQTKAAAMVSVRGIATEAAAAIIERLTGSAPANRDAVAAAVSEALKQ